MTELRPQPGPQEAFLATPADIALYGGAAGGGKTFALQLGPLRHIDQPAFRSSTFRRTYSEITDDGGLWDTSLDLYPQFGSVPNVSARRHVFPSGATISYRHLQHANTKYRYKGSQIPDLRFDELTSFLEGQFFYMLSRNRSAHGFRPTVRCGTNPDVDSWVRLLVDWWVDENTGYPIPERSGVVRFFTRDQGTYVWGDSVADVLRQAPSVQAVVNRSGIAPEHLVKSFTFIPASVYDNRILLEQDPGYVGNLLMQDKTEQERLLGGNWNISATSGAQFNKADIEIVGKEDLPADLVPSRHWDLAGSEPTEAYPDPDFTVGSLFAPHEHLVFCLDARFMRVSPDKVERAVRGTATQDGRRVTIYLEQEPGQSGKAQVLNYQRKVLRGFTVKAHRPDANKELRARPAAAASKRGDIKLLKGPWNEQALNQLHHFGSSDWHDDFVDTLSNFWETRMLRPDVFIDSI